MYIIDYNCTYNCTYIYIYTYIVYWCICSYMNLVHYLPIICLMFCHVLQLRGCCFFLKCAEVNGVAIRPRLAYSCVGLLSSHASHALQRNIGTFEVSECFRRGFWWETTWILRASIGLRWETRTTSTCSAGPISCNLQQDADSGVSKFQEFPSKSWSS